MRWEEALVATNRLEARITLAACELGYHDLRGGPALLAERERTLRMIVSLVPEGEELPIDLGRELLAWVRTTSMAQRRLPWDLPPSWSDVGSASR